MGVGLSNGAVVVVAVIAGVLLTLALVIRVARRLVARRSRPAVPLTSLSGYQSTRAMREEPREVEIIVEPPERWVHIRVEPFFKSRGSGPPSAKWIALGGHGTRLPQGRGG